MTSAGVKLLESARYGSIEGCDAALALGCSVDFRDEAGQTPLMMAAFHAHTAVCEYLILCGANVNAQDNTFGYTALHKIVSHAQDRACEVAKVLFDHGASPHIRSLQGTTPLHLAAEHGNAALALLLIQKGARVDQLTNGKDCHGERAGPHGCETPLMWGSWGRDANVETCRVLLEAGADVNFSNDLRYTALECAINKQRVDIVKFLLKSGARLDIIPSKLEDFHRLRISTRYPLPLQCVQYSYDTRNGDPLRMLQILIEQGVDVVNASYYGTTALHIAAMHETRSVELCGFLLSRGAKHTPDSSKCTPLVYAALSQLDETCDFLIRNGANARADAAAAIARDSPTYSRVATKIREAYDRVCAEAARAIRSNYIKMQTAASAEVSEQEARVIQAEARAKQAEENAQALEKELQAAKQRLEELEISSKPKQAEERKSET